MCTIKPQTVRLSGDMQIEATAKHLIIRHAGQNWVLHLSASGDVLGAHREPLLTPVREPAKAEAGSPPP